MIGVVINAKELLKSFDELQLKKQDAILRKAYYQGASVISRAAAYGLLGYFKGNTGSNKVRDMVNSFGYKYNKRGQFVSVYPVENTDNYYSYMTKWFVSGTKNRYAYTRESRKRKSGGFTKRKYKTTKKHFFGSLPGNNVVVTAYNAYRDKANEVIKESVEKQLINIWKKNGR